MKYGWECFKRSGQHPSPTLQSEAAALSFPLRRFLCKTSTQTSVQEVIVATVQTRPMATSCNLSKVPRAYLTVLNCTSFPAFLPGGNVCNGQTVQRDRTSHDTWLYHPVHTVELWPWPCLCTLVAWLRFCQD